ncbi:hypothetical protein C7B62_20920 [Pleurocapsa sp. CCALA 161]|uniref:hypothetical protein n=1 Tax=Pleurocapsa sp. CCALA 161 TaxID=2107688 RepID=UPI000D05B9A1|nr:hypothetical protein [Pleurocapsa sp. CCALA 161]PSB07099.1 hypothetical protein C7B62_20920 [Pleurocapsa sp. CCALA 161]
MFQPQDDFNQDQSQNAQNNSSDPNLDNIDANISAESVAVRKKQLESIFIKLIVFGLAVGAVLGIGAYYLLHKFGMTKKPDQLEQEKIIEQREQNPANPVQKIHDFPASDTDDYRFRL